MSNTKSLPMISICLFLFPFTVALTIVSILIPVKQIYHLIRRHRAMQNYRRLLCVWDRWTRRVNGRNRFMVKRATAIIDCIVVKICVVHLPTMSIQSVIHHLCCIQTMRGHIRAAARVEVLHNRSSSTLNNTNWAKIIHIHCPDRGDHHSKTVTIKVIVTTVIPTFSIRCV